MASTPPCRPRSVSPTSLAATFADLPDPHSAVCGRYPLPSVLALVMAVILANKRSVLAIAEWARRQEADLLAALGLPDERTPCQSPLQRRLRQRDGHALAICLNRSFAPSAAPATRSVGAVPAPQGITIDGKARRGAPLVDARGPTPYNS